MESGGTGARAAFAVLVGLISINAAYLAAFDSPTIFYHVSVLVHLALGVCLVVALALAAPRWLQSGPGQKSASLLPRLLLAASAVAMAVTGVWLVKVGTSTPYRSLLRAHEAAAIAFVLLLLPLALRSSASLRAASLVVVSISILLPVVARSFEAWKPSHVAHITNPALPPSSPYEEGEGKNGPFFPSSNRTRPAGLIPSDFFLESKKCGNRGCHPDITAQWESSAHHFSSFNNQWYRKSIEYMQDVIGTKPSKWCGGCHDMAILLTGRMDTPIREQINTPEAQAGIGCLVCHSVVHVPDTMGQGSFVLEYPAMHRLVASPNPVLQFLHDRMVLLDPAPHKQTMLKPFHRQSTPEFCASCHKVHLDEPVNHYRWFRGFDDYDPWQQSGVSHQGARAFYYPPEAKKCGTCHMPLVPSDDKGNVNGRVHSHRFPGANTALPLVNQDRVQQDVVKSFLTSGFLTVDIFAASEEPTGSAPASARGGSLEESPGAARSMFPDEGGLLGTLPAVSSAPRRLVAPLDRARVGARPGSSVRMDVVARTRNIGHFFPGGTVDAFDVWLELQATDRDGKVVFWNGWVADDGKGPVDPGAHFYRSVLVDENGNRINKRNAWAGRAVAYARLIPPGAADTARFVVRIPPRVRGPLRLTARMNYRKFNWWNTQWAYAGVRDPSQGPYALAPGHDDGRWVFEGDTSIVSGKTKGIPDLPVVVIAEDTLLLEVGEGPAAPAPVPTDRERWNDYGIGLLLARDFRGADAAFTEVTKIDPKWADGWVNRARVAVEEGDPLLALENADRALALAPDLAKAQYFRGLALRGVGRYDEALASFERAAASYPRDRAVWNAIGRVHFLKREYAQAIEAFRKTLAVDAEDLTAHYNLMLCFRGQGDTASAKVHETLYERFKADEGAQVRTGPFRRLNPDDNRERQPIHVHESTWTPENRFAASGERYRTGPPAIPTLLAHSAR